MSLMISIEESDLAAEFENDEKSFADLLDEIDILFKTVKRGRRISDWAAEVEGHITAGGKDVVNALHAALNSDA